MEDEGYRIAAWFEGWFDLATREHGRSLFEAGMAEVESVDDEGASGTVDVGAEAIEVEVVHDRLDGWRLTCACRAFASYRRCRHLWAFLLELQEACRADDGRSAQGFLRQLILDPPEIDEIEGRPAPILDLPADAAEGAGPSLRRGRLRFEYGPVVVEADAPGETILVDDPPTIVHRDRVAEADWRRRLDGLEGGALGEAVAAVEEAGGRAMLGQRRLRAAVVSDLVVATTGGCFEVRGRLVFGDRSVAVGSLAGAIGAGGATIDLGDGSRGLLPAGWLDDLLRLARPAASGDCLTFDRGQGWLVDLLVRVEPTARVDEDFARYRAGLATAGQPTAAEPPPGFVGSLRPYQAEGLGWLLQARAIGIGVCLADDMGLGKTVQILAYLESVADGPTLVVAPRSVVDNWRAEAGRFWPGVRTVEHAGPDRRRDGDFADVDLVLTSYGLLRRDIEFLAGVEFGTVVLDEAQAIKNPGSQTAVSARRLSARHRVALTGTPVENRLDDLWSLLEFLVPGLLGRSAAFRDLVASGKTDDLARSLRPFFLRRTKRAVAPDLPPRTEQVLLCDMAPAQAALYQEIEQGLRRQLSEGGPPPAGRFLEALLRLRQAACHPGLLDPAGAGEASGKFDALLPRLEEIVAEGNKALVFSQFTSLLDLLAGRLAESGLVHETLDGSTRDRAARVARFQEDPDCGLFLISLKAGGVGLNLTAAGYVFLLDPWWNPAVEAQAIDRTHRIGQSQPVNAYRLVSRGTVEERILDLQAAKRDLAERAIEIEGGSTSRPGLEEIARALFG